MTEENRVRDAADAVTGLVKAVPVYEDLARPAVREVGAVAGRAVRVLLMPVRGLVWSFEQIEQAVVEAVEARLRDVPEDQRQTPSPTVAVPAMQALTYTAQEPDLRELYFNLLAAAMDRRTATNAHPAFVEMIKQMTPDEARIFRRLHARGNSAPLISVKQRQKDETGEATALEYFGLIGFEAGCDNPLNVPEYVTNLRRLGLVDIPLGAWLAHAIVYEPLLAHETYTKCVRSIESRGLVPRLEKQVVTLTPLGDQFARACLG